MSCIDLIPNLRTYCTLQPMFAVIKLPVKLRRLAYESAEYGALLGFPRYNVIANGLLTGPWHSPCRPGSS